jgi:hypothetical protein
MNMTCTHLAEIAQVSLHCRPKVGQHDVWDVVLLTMLLDDRCDGRIVDLRDVREQMMRDLACRTGK